MKMSFRWYGQDDPVTLKEIKQIPGVKGIVSAIYDIKPGQAWPLERIKDLKNTVTENNLELIAIESVPVHEDIKMGTGNRDLYIDNYIRTLKNLSIAGVKVLCYNFMPVFDWTRSDLGYSLPDGSTTLVYDHNKVKKMNPLEGKLELPGWDKSYQNNQLKTLLEKYSHISEEDLWDNLQYFLEKIIPYAEEYDIKMAIHPDDPPWSIFDLPRIITDKNSLEKLINLIDSPSNGIALCSGSLGVNPDNNIPEIIRCFGEKQKIHFAHVRNVKITADRSFQETAHKSEKGSLDMYEIMKAYYDTGFKGPVRPDHGRMIWGETGKPGYGLYDRALGSVYLNGILEALSKTDI